MRQPPLFEAEVPAWVDSRDSDVWLTPPFIIDALGGADSFDLDPCAPPDQPFPTALRRFTEGEDGLLLPWDGRVWLNPPYSTQKLAGFMGRMVDHGRGVALLPAATDTRLFFEAVWNRATACLFVKGRIFFLEPDGRMSRNSAGASVLVAYGAYDADILASQPLEGQFVPLILPATWLVTLRSRTWAEALAEFAKTTDKPFTLAQLYRFFAVEPKSRRNPHWQAKLRQELQRGPQYVRVGPGIWQRRHN